MMDSRRLLIHNGLWNIVAGMSSAVLTVGLPPLLTRLLPPDQFGAWAFCFQIASYVLLLNFGLQVIIGHFVSTAEAKGDRKMRDEVVSTAVAVLAFAGVAGVLMLLAISQQIEHLVPSARPELQAEMQLTVLILGFSFALFLPASVLGAVFIGLRQNAIYAATIIPLRLLTFMAVLVACWLTRSLLGMAIAWLSATVMGIIIGIALWLGRCPQPKLSLTLISRSRLRELTTDASTITAWTMAGLLSTGLQAVVVARFDFSNLAPFAIASSLAMFTSGLMQAVANTSVPQSSHLIAMGRREEFVGLLNSVTKLNVMLSSLISIPLIAAAPYIMSLWAGPANTSMSGPLLASLVLAQAIRNLMLVYTMTTIAVRLQRKIILTPLIEGAVGFLSGFLLGMKYGALGVAVGWIVGSSVGVVLLMFQDVIGKWEDLFSRRNYIVRSVLVPFFGTGLVATLYLVSFSHRVSREPLWMIGVAALCLFVTLQLGISRAQLIRASRTLIRLLPAR